MIFKIINLQKFELSRILYTNMRNYSYWTDD